ncbi:hypothetical protein [Rheinheimera gaetbuli]
MNNKEQLNKASKKQVEIENSVLNGNFEKALSNLEIFEIEHGKSVWSVDKKISILVKSKNTDGLDKYKKNLEKEDISHISTLIYRKYTSSSSASFYNQVLKNLLIEYRENGYSGYADFISILLLPDTIENDYDLSSFIMFSQRLTAIDRLFFLKKIITSSVIAKKIDSDILNTISEMSDSLSTIDSQLSWRYVSNLISGIAESRTADSSTDIIKLYSAGKYEDTIKKCKEKLELEEKDLSIIDIYARSIIHIDDEAEVERLKKNPEKLSNSFTMVLVGFHYSIDNFDFQKSIFEYLSFQYQNYEFIKSVKPMFFSAYPKEFESQLESSCLELYCSNNEITPKYTNIVKSWLGAKDTDKENKLSYNNTRSREIRILLEEEIFATHPNKETVDELLSELKNNNDVLLAEYYRIWYQSKLSTEQHYQIIDKVCDLIIENNNFQHLFPLKEIVDIIERNREIHTDNIKSVIIYNLYYKFKDYDCKESMSEFFEDFLTKKGCAVASELAKNWQEGKVGITEEYFLKEVCKPDVMSIFLKIETNEDLLFERLKILHELRRLTVGNEDYILSEDLKIYEQLYIDILSRQHASSKLDIDVDGIKNSKLGEYESHFTMLDQLNSGELDDLLELFKDDLENKTTKLDNAIVHFYGRAYEDMLQDFIFNEDFGLVRYLSSEIRHGWLPNKIRSVLEGFNIVTELGPNKKYEKNKFWREQLQLTLTPAFLDMLDDVLAEFSEKVDHLIERANSWPKVTRILDDNNSAFNLHYGVNDILAYREHTRTAISPEDFFYKSNDFIWLKLEHCFNTIKSLLNNELKPNFNKIFDDLIIKSQSIGVKLNQLNQEIESARLKTIESIDEIESWFCRPNFRFLGEVSFDDIIKVSIRNIIGLYSPRVISFDCSFKHSEFYIEQSKTLHLIRALSTSFQNCLKHGIKSKAHDVSIRTSNLDSRIVLNISNTISKKSAMEVSKKGIIDKVNNYNPELNGDLLTKEGGTGLYKMYRFITDAFPKSTFKVDLRENTFQQIVTFEITRSK